MPQKTVEYISISSDVKKVREIPEVSLKRESAIMKYSQSDVNIDSIALINSNHHLSFTA